MSASEVYTNEDDQAAFVEVYRAHHGKLLRYCQYRLRDRYEAEDVAQEAFARAWRTMPGSAFDRNFYPWLRVVASNLCTDVQRKRNHSEPVATLEIPGYDPNVERVVEDSDRALVRQALGRLNERHRSALMMRESEGLTYDQIAERTGVTSGTVESLLWRARQSLKREFTVLAGEGAFVFIPFLVVLADRVRSTGRRAWSRLAGFAGPGDQPAAHAAVAAIAAITVATGVIATLGMGGSHGGAPAVVLHLTRPAASVSAAPSTAAPTAPAVTGPAVPATRATGSSPGGTRWPGSGGVGGSGSGPLHYTNPIGPTGHRAAVEAQGQPVVVNVPRVVVVGINPQMIPVYATGVLKKLGL